MAEGAVESAFRQVDDALHKNHDGEDQRKALGAVATGLDLDHREVEDFVRANLPGLMTLVFQIGPEGLVGLATDRAFLAGVLYERERGDA